VDLIVFLLAGLLGVTWIFGALLSLKLDAVLCNSATDWADLPVALIFWMPVAALMLCVKHPIYDERGPADEYRH